jgi:hypothetical protein
MWLAFTPAVGQETCTTDDGFGQGVRVGAYAMQSHRNQEPTDRPADESEEKRARREGEPAAPEEPEDRPGEPGAEGGAQSPTRDKLPGMPAKDDPSPVGDTDQHSTA